MVGSVGYCEVLGVMRFGGLGERLYAILDDFTLQLRARGEVHGGNFMVTSVG